MLNGRTIDMRAHVDIDGAIRKESGDIGDERSSEPRSVANWYITINLPRRYSRELTSHEICTHHSVREGRRRVLHDQKVRRCCNKMQ